MNAADRPVADPRPSDASEATRIGRWLVRLAPSGHVLWAGSIHSIAARRGDAVVVATSTGAWWGEVLSLAQPAAPGEPGVPSVLPAAEPVTQDAVTQRPPPAADERPAGEVLRLADDDDRAALATAAALAERLRDAACQWWAGQTGHTSATIVILSAEVSLDLHVGVIGVLGPTDERFGRAAAELAAKLQLQRVQWIRIQDEDASTPTGSPGSGGQATAGSVGPLVMTPQQAADELFWERYEASIHDGRSLGSQYRVAAGNRGLYQQKLRGAAPAGRRLTPGRSWMVRVRTAAGGIAPGQLDQLMQLAVQFGDGSLRLTTRQAIQLHGVLPQSPGDVVQQLQQAALFTAGSCGNAVRNLTCCPMPPRTAVERLARRLAVQLASQLLPRGPAFEFRSGDALLPADIAPVADAGAVHQDGSFPHKWKVGVTSAGHNCIDVLTNDFAVVIGQPGHRDRSGPASEPGVRVGTEPATGMADIYVGGSTAYQAETPGSTAALAIWLGSVPVTAVGAVACAALEVFRTSAVEGPRHWQRWKYTVQRLGIDEVAERIQHTVGGTFSLQRSASAPAGIAAVQTHRGAWRQADGRFTLAQPIPGGRLAAAGQPAAALRQLAALAGAIRVGPRHTLVLADVAANDKFDAQRLLETWSPPETLPHLSAVACPALPTCPLAVAAAETQVHSWIDALQPVAASAGVPLPDFALSGCTNGCSHPLTTAIGVVAETPRQWRVYLGGDGRQMGAAVATVAGPPQLAELLADWLQRFAGQRAAGEAFGDWFWRQAAPGDGENMPTAP